MPYRDDLEALEQRCKALETQSTSLSTELAEARRLLEEAHAQRKLPVVDALRPAAPCASTWDSMTGDAHVRACTACAQNVYNVGSLPRDEARSLLTGKAGQCARFFQRADGPLRAHDCAVGVRHKRRQRRRVIAAVLGVAAIYGAVITTIYLHDVSARRAAAARAAPMERAAAVQRRLQQRLDQEADDAARRAARAGVFVQQLNSGALRSAEP